MKGDCIPKNVTLHRRLSPNCTKNTNNTSHVYIERIFHIIPADIPISRYRTAHTTAKAMPGGVNGDLRSEGYHSTIAGS